MNLEDDIDNEKSKDEEHKKPEDIEFNDIRQLEESTTNRIGEWEKHTKVQSTHSIVTDLFIYCVGNRI